MTNKLLSDWHLLLHVPMIPLLWRLFQAVYDNFESVDEMPMVTINSKLATEKECPVVLCIPPVYGNLLV